MKPIWATTRTMPSQTGVTVRRLDKGIRGCSRITTVSRTTPLVHDAVELDVVEQGARNARSLRIQEYGCAGHPHGWIDPEVLEEIPHRLLLAQQAGHERGAPFLPFASASR